MMISAPKRRLQPSPDPWAGQPCTRGAHPFSPCELSPGHPGDCIVIVPGTTASQPHRYAIYSRQTGALLRVIE